jgi:hypothetical protein
VMVEQIGERHDLNDVGGRAAVLDSHDVFL